VKDGTTCGSTRWGYKEDAPSPLFDRSRDDEKGSVLDFDGDDDGGNEEVDDATKEVKG